MTTRIWIVDVARWGERLEAVERAERRLPDGLEETFRGPGRPARLAAHIAMRLLIERHAGPRWRRVPFTRASGGKPLLAGSGLELSLAHSGERALVALSDAGPIGVDIERIRAVRMCEAHRRQIARAADVLACSGPGEGGVSRVTDRELIIAWTRLEAYAKATGEGIGALLDRIGRATDAGPEVERPLQELAQGRHIHQLQLLQIEQPQGTEPLLLQGYAASAAIPAGESVLTASLTDDRISDPGR